MAKRTTRPPKERFWAKVNKNGPIPEHRPDLGPCWLWAASVDRHGYGWFGLTPRVVRRAHIYAYEWEVGRVPEGLELDHLCRRPSCVRPMHLEAVTHLENSLRGLKAMATHCVHGHPYTEENTYRAPGKGRRECRTCRLARMHQFRERHKDAMPV